MDVIDRVPRLQTTGAIPENGLRTGKRQSIDFHSSVHRFSERPVSAPNTLSRLTKRLINILGISSNFPSL